ncbi:N-acetylmuramoyl-L-alanine amidase [Staphylococcus equorum]|uniref:N-acetylmuramoyl-L-alanine amidase n=1 Tax=Staphylococcus equorum TaxID=246432 RepID=A0A9X4LC84_9STAP|nr:N-acetylmuramoyl-L-alanine amidase [Staphylococcus equorum]MDG0844038.1 N-acetylmuramoyl-L-alanine amidase [Staphylococcus equorum]MDG0859967.1 N-acetylmuramoyl-L-alanine amidase [Staphylococcus equorum]
MNHIYSNFYTTYNKITNLKPDILGIVLHDDAENYAAHEYIEWLNNRIAKNELEKGWASVYVDVDTCFWFHPTEYIEWHCGNNYANTHFIGIERCQSKRGGVLTDQEFMENEEVSFRVAALLLKKYNLPVNRNTVRIHKEFFETECPDRAWKIHLEDAQTNPESILKLKDYFISKIQGYYNKVVDSEVENIG